MAECIAHLIRRPPAPRALRWLLGALLSAAAWSANAAQVGTAQLSTLQDGTRITIESDQPLSYQLFRLSDPARLVLDLDEPSDLRALEALANQVGGSNPHIRGARVGRFKPGVARIVFDLRADIESRTRQAPLSSGSHQFVLDIRDSMASDPLMAMLSRVDADASPAIPSQPPSQNGTQAKVAPTPSGGARKPAADVAAQTERAQSPEQPAQARTPSPTARVDQAPVERLITVAIDAGHGGADPGARGASGNYEKVVTLAIARKLKDVIDQVPSMRGVLIRDGDHFIPLHQRVIKARNVQADLFVSIHADAFIKPHAKGSSVFALSERGATSAAARWLAKKENDADLIGGVNIDVADPNLKRVLLDLSQTATINDSLKLGRAVLGEIGNVNSLHKAHVEQAGFAVLKAPDIPSILVETAFITNPEEEARLTDEDYQVTLANAIANGIRRYFAKNPPLARGRATLSDASAIGPGVPGSEAADITLVRPANAHEASGQSVRRVTFTRPQQSASRARVAETPKRAAPVRKIAKPSGTKPRKALGGSPRARVVEPSKSRGRVAACKGARQARAASCAPRATGRQPVGRLR